MNTTNQKVIFRTIRCKTFTRGQRSLSRHKVQPRRLIDNPTWWNRTQNFRLWIDRFTELNISQYAIIFLFSIKISKSQHRVAYHLILLTKTLRQTRYQNSRRFMINFSVLIKPKKENLKIAKLCFLQIFQICFSFG